MKPKFRGAYLLVGLSLLILLSSAIVYAWPTSRTTLAARLASSSLEDREETARSRSRAWFVRGQEAAARGDLRSAANAWQISLQLGAPADEVYPRLVEVHRRLGDIDNLDVDLAALVASQPDDPVWQYQLGLIQVVQQPGEARAHLARAAELDPDLVQKVRLLERGLSTNLLSTDPAFQLVASGRALASIGEWELAGLAFEKATRLNPTYAEAWAFLGAAKRQSGQDGLPELQKAVNLNRQSVAANTFLGLYWQQSGRLDLALVYLDAAARQDSGNPVLQAALGKVLAQQGKLPEALRHYQRAAAAYPRDPLYWRALAGFTIEFATQVEEVGLPAARTAVLLSSSDPASLDTMAQVYILLGNPLIARRFLERALAAEPDYAPARLHLGLIEILQGNASAARQHLQLAESLASTSSQVEEQAHRLLSNTQP